MTWVGSVVECLPCIYHKLKTLNLIYTFKILNKLIYILTRNRNTSEDTPLEKQRVVKQTRVRIFLGSPGELGFMASG